MSSLQNFRSFGEEVAQSTQEGMDGRDAKEKRRQEVNVGGGIFEGPHV